MLADRPADQDGRARPDRHSRPDRPRQPDGRHASAVRLIRRPWAVAAAIAGALVICAAAGGLLWAGHTGRAAAPLGTAPLVPIPQGHWAAVPPAEAKAVARPTALAIPAIGVDTRLIKLGLTASGDLQVPSSTSVAGWYTGSPRPGATGAAVIAGHIDSYQGPGVFFRLRELKRGDLIYVRRGHSSMAVFRVTEVRTFLKTQFPKADVYGAVPDSELRLITCGGTFDPQTGHYLSNVIAFATLLP
jgi:LPXTG-site transpeptidase (sortase) family protein